MVGFFAVSKLATRFRSRHFWRKATFSEISALYVSKVLRLLALNLVSTFILIYLYQTGRSLLYLAIFSTFRAIIAVIATPVAAMLTAQFGAKKIIALSSLIYIPAFLCYADLSSDFWIALGGLLQSLAVVLYQVAHDVIFSEVASESNAGKEIGYMAIFEKVTAILSPVVGGILSSFVSPIAVMILASILFMASAWPLFKTKGVVKQHHLFKFSALPFRVYVREMLCQIGPGFDAGVDKVWPVFLVVAVFAQHDAYLLTGAATSIASAVAVLAAFVVGKMLDRGRKYGRTVFLVSSFASAVAHLTKAFVHTPLGMLANIVFAGSAVTTKDISSLKAQFWLADRSGARVVYLMYRHLFWNLFSLVAFLIWSLLMFYGDAITNLRTFFVVAGIAATLYGFSGYWLKSKV